MIDFIFDPFGFYTPNYSNCASPKRWCDENAIEDVEYEDITDEVNANHLLEVKNQANEQTDKQ